MRVRVPQGHIIRRNVSLMKVIRLFPSQKQPWSVKSTTQDNCLVNVDSSFVSYNTFTSVPLCLWNIACEFWKPKNLIRITIPIAIVFIFLFVW